MVQNITPGYALLPFFVALPEAVKEFGDEMNLSGKKKNR